MKKFLKYIGFFSAGLIAILLIAIISLNLIPDSKYKDWITSAVQSTTGRVISIEALNVDFGSTIHINADNIRLANTDWGSQDDMLTIKRLELDFRLLGVLSGKADIRVVVEQTEVLAEKNVDGTSNWDFGFNNDNSKSNDGSKLTGLPLDPYIREIRIDDFKLTLLAKPDADAKTFDSLQLLMETQENDTLFLLSTEFNGHPVMFSGNLGDVARLLYEGSVPVQLTGDINGNKLNLSGSWGPLFPEQTLQIDFDLKTPSSTQLAALAGLGDEEFGAIDISGKLSANDSVLSLSPLHVSLDGQNADLKIDGSISDLNNMKGINIAVEANTSALNHIIDQLRIELPVALPPEFELRSKINGDLNKLALTDLDIVIKDKGIGFEITGSVGDLLTVSSINILAKAEIRSFSKKTNAQLEVLFKLAGVEFPLKMLPQSIALSSTIQGSLEQLSLKDFQGEILDKDIKIALSADVANILEPSGITAELSLDSKSIAALSKFAGKKLPQTDPLKVVAQLTEKDAKNFVSVNATLGEVNIDLITVLEKLALPELFEAAISIKAPSMSAFNKLAQSEFPEQGPFDLSAKLQVQKNNFTVNDLKLALKNQSATGNLSISYPEVTKEPVDIKGKLDIAFLDLSFLLPEVEIEPEVTPATTASVPAASTGEVVGGTETDSDRLFSSDPFILESLHAYDIDFAVNASNIKLGKTNMKDVVLAISQKGGLFSIDPIKATSGAGNMKGFIRIDGRQDIPDLKGNLAINQAPAPNLGGKFDFDVELEGKGVSVAELMASLNGRILLVMRDGKIEGEMVKKLGSGLLSFSKEKSYTTLECGILRVDIKDGIADFKNNLAAQLTEVTWRGGGTVNLKTEKLGVGIVPKPRRGIPVSLTGTLSGLVYVGGTLKNPHFQLDPKDVAIKYAKYTAHFSTGGLTFIAEKIKDKIEANQDICEKILDGTVFDHVDKKKLKEKEKAAKEVEKDQK